MTESLEPELQEKSGSSFLEEISRTTSSLRPLAILSVSISVTKPYLYGWLTDPRERTGHSGQPALAWMVSMEIVRVPRSNEGIVLRKEQHAVTLASFTHRNTGAVPEGLRRLSLLVVVMTARTRNYEYVLVTGQTLRDN